MSIGVPAPADVADVVAVEGVGGLVEFEDGEEEDEDELDDARQEPVQPGRRLPYSLHNIYTPP